MTEEAKQKQWTPQAPSKSPCGTFLFKPMKTGMRITHPETGETVKLTYNQWEALWDGFNSSSSYRKFQLVEKTREWHSYRSEPTLKDVHKWPRGARQARVLTGYWDKKLGVKVKAGMPSLFMPEFQIEIKPRYYNTSSRMLKVEHALNDLGNLLCKTVPKPPPESEWPKKGPRKPGSKIRLTPAQQRMLNGWPTGSKGATPGWPNGTSLQGPPVYDHWRYQATGNCTLECLEREGLVERGIIGVDLDPEGNVNLTQRSRPRVAFRLTIKGALHREQ